MSNFEPNHICKNKFCTKGNDGGRKHYYACDYCTRTQSWKSVACSFECYQAYVDQVIEARSNNKKVNTLPERTDLTDDEFKNLMSKPIDIVKKETAKELQEFSDNDGNIDFSMAVDEINKKAESKQRKTNKKNNI